MERQWIARLVRDMSGCVEAQKWVDRNERKGRRWLYDNCPRSDWFAFLLAEATNSENPMLKKLWVSHAEYLTDDGMDAFDEGTKEVLRKALSYVKGLGAVPVAVWKGKGIYMWVRRSLMNIDDERFALWWFDAVLELVNAVEMLDHPKALMARKALADQARELFSFEEVESWLPLIEKHYLT